jgi:hypothetical protein
MHWRKLLRFLGVVLFLLGCLTGLYLAIVITDASIKGVFSTIVSDSPTDRFQRFECPLLLNESETASVAAVILNPTGDVLDYSVHIEPGGFSIGSAEKELGVTISGGQTARVAWVITAVERGTRVIAIQAISSSDAARPGPFHLWTTSFREGCGILVVDGPLTGAQFLWIVLGSIFAGGVITFQWLYTRIRQWFSARR